MIKTVSIPISSKLVELIIYHNNDKALSLLTEENLVDPFCKVTDLAYNLGLRDMNRAVITPSLN